MRCLAPLITVYWLLITSARAASPDAALDAYHKGSFRSSQAQYSQLAKEKPEDARLRFNAGAAAYKNNDLTNAANWFESVVGAPDLNLQQQAYYNLGNTRYKLGEASPDPQARMKEWQQSLQHLGSALKLNAADTNALNNLIVVSNRVQELAKRLPKNQQQQGGKEGQGKNANDQQGEQQPDLPEKGLKDSDKEETNDPNTREGDDKLKKDKQGDQASNRTNQPPDVANTNRTDQAQSSQQQAQAEQEQKAAEEAEKKAQQAQAQQSGEEQGQNNAGAGNESFAEQQGKPGEMSVVQAERMLDQQKGNEKAMVFRAAGASGKEAAQRPQRNRKQW